MGKIVGFVSEKGGVGKTTACYEISVGLVRNHNKRVLVVDADYQLGGITGRLDGSLLKAFAQGQISHVTLFHKFQQLYSASPVTPGLSVLQSKVGVDFIPADPRLSSVSNDKRPTGRTLNQQTTSLLEYLQVVDDALAQHKDEYDYIMIDSHPEVSSLLRSVIFASDYAVSPVKLDLQSSIGVSTVISEINGVNNDVASIQRNLGGVPQNYTSTAFVGGIGMMAREYRGFLKSTEYSEYYRLSRAGQMFESYVTEGDGIRQAAQNRTTVRDISIANAKKQSEQFDDVTKEFLKKCP